MDSNTEKVLSLEDIIKSTRWIAKFETGGRTSGTYEEVEHLENLRDLDIACVEGQPEFLKPFYIAYEAYFETSKKFTTVQEYYPIYIAELNMVV